MEAGSSKAGHASPPLQHQQIYAEIDKFYPGAAAAGDQQIYYTVQDPPAGPSWTPGNQQLYQQDPPAGPSWTPGHQQLYQQDPAAGPSWTPGNQQLYHGQQLYSSSGSASSDQNTSSTDYSVAPLRSVI